MKSVKIPSKQPEAPRPNPNPLGENGYPDKAKTSGIKIRGTGAATKGTMARGPMA